jgi:DNA (cytosine-5)-methyltransferase 1
LPRERKKSREPSNKFAVVRRASALLSRGLLTSLATAFGFMNYYNEYDKNAAAWLRVLISENLIAPGEVDERDIQDVRASELVGYAQCHFFAGIGGWSLALRLAGWPDDDPVWTASCPCQPFSLAGDQAGTNDERHLWPSTYRLIEQRKPSFVFGEQVKTAIEFGWLDAVFSDMEKASYTCGASVLGAHSVGIDQKRQRIYWGCHSNPNSLRLKRQRNTSAEPWSRKQFEGLVQMALRISVPTGKSGGLSYGLPSRLAQLRGYGNAIVPQVAAEFIQAYIEAVK